MTFPNENQTVAICVAAVIVALLLTVFRMIGCTETVNLKALEQGKPLPFRTEGVPFQQPYQEAK